MNIDGDKNTSFLNLPEKQSLRTPNFSQHKFPVTSFDNNCQNDAAQARNMLKQIPVSTGLKLSYGEEEPNSSISSPGESMRVNLSSILSQSHNNNLQSEFARQSNEFDQYIMIQVHSHSFCNLLCLFSNCSMFYLTKHSFTLMCNWCKFCGHDTALILCASDCKNVLSCACWVSDYIYLCTRMSMFEDINSR